MAWKGSEVEEAEEDTFSALNWQNYKTQMLVSLNGGKMHVEGHFVYKCHNTEMNHLLQSRENAGEWRKDSRSTQYEVRRPKSFTLFSDLRIQIMNN